eukprot:947465-Prymnesium_polylepis.1
MSARISWASTMRSSAIKPSFPRCGKGLRTTASAVLARFSARPTPPRSSISLWPTASSVQARKSFGRQVAGSCRAGRSAHHLMALSTSRNGPVSRSIG